MLETTQNKGVKAPLGTQITVPTLPAPGELPETTGAGPPCARGMDRAETSCLGLGLPGMGAIFLAL